MRYAFGERSDMPPEMTQAELQVWPVRVRFPGGTVGATLWGSAGGENDVVLAQSGRLIFAKSTLRLRAWCRENLAQTNFSDLPLAVKLQAWCQPRGGSWASAAFYDFEALEKQFRLPLTAPPKLHDLVECLNFIWDMANTLEAAPVVDAMRGGRALGEFMNAATFGQVDDVARQLGSPAVASALDAALRAAIHGVWWVERQEAATGVDLKSIPQTEL